MPSDILTLDTVKAYLGLEAGDARTNDLLDIFLSAEDDYLQRLRGPHPTDVDERDARLPEILLKLVVLAYRASPYANSSKLGVSVAAKDYDTERQRILEPLRWYYG